MHQTLYRKWRPLTFDDVYGQEHVTSILRHQVAGGKTSHAYLFCGSRGTGKTTCAKLLARALNCENPDSQEAKAMAEEMEAELHLRHRIRQLWRQPFLSRVNRLYRTPKYTRALRSRSARRNR